MTLINRFAYHMSHRISLIFLILTFFIFGCSSETELPKSSDKEIITFVIKKTDGTEFSAADFLVNWSGRNIEFTLPYGTERNGLVPEFTIKGVSVQPGSGIKQDFTKPVYYTVTAQDGSSAQYTVTVKYGAAPLIYFGGSDSYLYCLDGGTGAQLWRYKGEGQFVYSSPTYANNTIYIGSTESYVYAIDPKQGYTKWMKKIATTGIESDAVYADGTVYVGTNDDELYALDGNTGSTKWVFRTGGNISASPTIDNGTVYFGSSDGKLYALNANTGTQKWAYQTGAMINQSGPALSNGVLYVGSRDSYVYAINAADG
ncbi:MAG TPA: PQQ-binding-like beta-propeller repeat protein, partial [Chitinophagaceae bacterium]|nr:PQQ-binding-like beta-propeller repeat protein [Chitinophagaceae bacterium]